MFAMLSGHHNNADLDDWEVLMSRLSRTNQEPGPLIIFNYSNLYTHHKHTHMSACWVDNCKSDAVPSSLRSDVLPEANHSVSHKEIPHIFVASEHWAEEGQQINLDGTTNLRGCGTFSFNPHQSFTDLIKLPINPTQRSLGAQEINCLLQYRTLAVIYWKDRLMTYK